MINTTNAYGNSNSPSISDMVKVYQMKQQPEQNAPTESGSYGDKIKSLLGGTLGGMIVDAFTNAMKK